MAKYFTSLEDLVGQIVSHGSDIENRILFNDPSSCFKIGMKYLLGIDTPINLKKAKEYFEKQSIADEPETRRLLGFIAEMEGNYSTAFNYYYHAACKTDEENFYAIVLEERVALKEYLSNLGLPTLSISQMVTNVLQKYCTGGKKQSDANMMLALIGQDESKYIEVAKNQFELGKYSDALAWLFKGNVRANNQLFNDTVKKFNETEETLLMKVENNPIVEIEDNSLLLDVDFNSFFVKVEEALKSLSSKCIEVWKTKNSSLIKIKVDIYKKKEKARKKKEQLEEKASQDRIIKIIIWSIIFIVIFLFFLKLEVPFMGSLLTSALITGLIFIYYFLFLKK